MRAFRSHFRDTVTLPPAPEESPVQLIITVRLSGFFTLHFSGRWRPTRIPGGYVVRDANGQALAYVHLSESGVEALQAKVLTKDEARRIGRQFRM